MVMKMLIIIFFLKMKACQITRGPHAGERAKYIGC